MSTGVNNKDSQLLKKEGEKGPDENPCKYHKMPREKADEDKGPAGAFSVSPPHICSSHTCRGSKIHAKMGHDPRKQLKLHNV